MDDTEKVDVDKVVGAYAKLPDSIKQKLVNDQVRIILYDKLEGPATKLTYAASSYSAPEYYTYDQGSDAKVTNENYTQQEIKDHASGKVRINNAVIRISSGKYEEQALLHSVGHWIDDMNSSDGKRLSASQANGFESLYEKYKTTLQVCRRCNIESIRNVCGRRPALYRKPGYAAENFARVVCLYHHCDQ